MKQLIHLIIFGLVILLATACEDQCLQTQRPPSSSQSIISHTIPLDSAINNMWDFIQVMDNDKGRSVKTHIDIAQIITVPSDSKLSRAEENDTLLYIVNFADSAGFVILAADDRVDESVIAYGSAGNLSLNAPSISTDITIGYPTTGPGIYSIRNYPGKRFINPNTINLYDENVDDRLVGTFNSYGVPFSNVNSSKDTPDLLLIDLAKVGAINPDGSSAIGQTTTMHTYSNWIKSKSVEPLLSQYNFWTQSMSRPFISNVFNNYHPIVTKFNGDTRTASAGCFPLAIAKLMTFFSTPANYYYNNKQINWDVINSVESVNDINLDFRDNVSRLTISIANFCSALYFYEGTFVFPSMATATMRDLGFQSANRIKYDDNKIISMLNQQRPLIIYAAPQYNITKSHAWNIDGYMDYTRTHTTRKYDGNRCFETTQETQLKRYIHCDFGQGSSNYNGYYISGMFDMNSAYSLDNEPSNSAKKYNYDTWVHIITYNGIN